MKSDGNRRVNGVFKGGGAKGVAYAGALRACEEGGIEFEAVAGASAGAIAATLVACRYKADDLERLLKEALSTLPSPYRAFLSLGRSSLFRSRELENWLEGVIRKEVPVRHSGPATFGDILDESGIDLFVVAMDVSSRQPVVFSGSLSREAEVASAVAASAAIPVAFPPLRVVSENDVHRLIDGGTYANYPSFVFHDEEFRKFHGQPSTTSPTLGFTLEEGIPEEPLTAQRLAPLRRGRLATDRGALARDGGALGHLLSSPVFRAVASLGPLALCVAVAFFVSSDVNNELRGLGWLPDRVIDPIFVGLSILTATAFGLALAAAVILARLGRDLLDVGVMGARAAIGVGPSVPYWVGASGLAGREGHTVVRIPVPPELSTLAFEPSTDVVQEAVASGYGAACRTLGIAPRREIPAVSSAAVSIADPTPTSFAQAVRRWLTFGNVAWAFGVPVLCAMTVFSVVLAIQRLDVGDEGAALFGMVLSLVAASGALALILRRKDRLSANPYPLLGAVPSAGLWVLAGLASVISVLFMAWPIDDPSMSALIASTRVDGEVIDVRGDASPYVVDVQFRARNLGGVAALPPYQNSSLTPCVGTRPTAQPSISELTVPREMLPQLTVPRQTCYTFDSDNDALDGVVTVAVDTDRGVHHVVTEDWLGTFGTTRLVLALTSIGCLIATYHFLRAIRWRKDRSTVARIRGIIRVPAAGSN